MRHPVAYATPWGTIRTGPGFDRLTKEEQEAVLAHERGHVFHRHALKRLLWVLTFRAMLDFGAFLDMCVKQEFEADRYAVDCGHRVGLATFLLRRRLVGRSPGYPSARERLEAING